MTHVTRLQTIRSSLKAIARYRKASRFNVSAFSSGCKYELFQTISCPNLPDENLTYHYADSHSWRLPYLHNMRTSPQMAGFLVNTSKSKSRNKSTFIGWKQECTFDNLIPVGVLHNFSCHTLFQYSPTIQHSHHISETKMGHIYFGTVTENQCGKTLRVCILLPMQTVVIPLTSMIKRISLSNCQKHH